MSNKIPDRYLALGLDRLTRDEDPKRHDLVFIDYKSLGVRQLGSIYEGLLEFKIRVAPEKMAVVQGKKTEEVIPYKEAVKTKRKILTKGRGSNAVERVYHPGEVYLENDRRERKATGSYYTPDHIVKYIVQHTVGPVLDEKFERLRITFREAQQAYRKALRRDEALHKQGMKPDDPAKVANSYRHLVEELFDLRVLDPAMGSGHFLVEAVDFVCDRILGQKEGFLQAFPWNPVTASLQETRQAILEDMERQNVSIDASRLTDINLLKRHILKRCIYGVDLNPMAVELAKVSLWLDCFTLGAPLSFLDHHLKCGNSLIGTTVQEVEAELATKVKSTFQMFGGPFQGLLSATALVEELRRLPDATIEQTERSHALYDQFEQAMAPYKAALDIWLSRYFGNKCAQEYLTLVGQDYVEEIRSGGKGLSPQYQEVITEAARTCQEKRFFHWDLEFPEAFVDLERKTWKPKDKQGFDGVIGNPPWLSYSGRQRVSISSEVSRYYKHRFFSAIGGWLSTQALFLEQGVDLIRQKGYLGLIVPAQISDLRSFDRIRLYLSDHGSLEEPCPYHGEDAFEGVTEPSITVVFSRGAPNITQLTKWGIASSVPSSTADTSDNRVDVLQAVLQRMANLSAFGPSCFGDPGVHTGNCSRELIIAERSGSCVPVREGRDIRPFNALEPRLFLRLDVKKEDGKYFRIGPLERYKKCPIILRQTASRPMAAMHRYPTYFRNSVLACYGMESIPNGSMVAILNSDLFGWLHLRNRRDAQQRAFPQVKIGHLSHLPKPPIDDLQASARVQGWLERLRAVLEGAKEE